MESTKSLSGRALACRKRVPMAALLLALAACGGDDEGAPLAGGSPPAGCSAVQSPMILGKNHIQPTAVATYNSVPPTSGDHYPVPARVGVYADGIPNGVQVHNLEHGHVMVQYRDLTPSQQTALEAVVKADPRMVLMAPYQAMTDRLALTSWGKIQTCTEWSEGVVAMVRAFIKAHRDHAPESIP